MAEAGREEVVGGSKAWNCMAVVEMDRKQSEEAFGKSEQDLVTEFQIQEVISALSSAELRLHHLGPVGT